MSPKASSVVLLLAYLVCFSTNFTTGQPDSSRHSPHQTLHRNQVGNNDVDFEMADFEVQYQLNGSLALLQAYRVRRRPQQTDGPSMQWVTAGYPQLVPNQRGRMLQFDPEGVTVFINFLDDGQRLALLTKARSIYSLDPDVRLDTVIRPLPLTQFSCLAQFVLQNGQLYEVHGRVTDFNRTPLSLTFPVPVGGQKRTAFERRLRLNARLMVTCELTSTGRQEQTASLSISSDQFQRMNLTDKMFGPASEVYVSRKQAVELSGEIMSALRVEEYYDSDVDQFSESYIQGLVKLAHSSFQPVTFDQALASLSGYGLSLGQNGVEPNAVKTALQNEFHVVDTNRKQLLTVGDGSARASNPVAQAIFETFDGDQDRQFVESKRNAWNQSTLSIDQQVAEINNQPGRSIWWTVQEGKIVPKELNVLRLSRNIVGQNMKFELIKRRPINVAFFKNYVLELDSQQLQDRAEGLEPSNNGEGESVESGVVESIIDEKLKKKLNDLSAKNPLKHQCRQVVSGGYRSPHGHSFARVNMLEMIHRSDPECQTTSLNGITQKFDANDITFTRYYDCRRANGQTTTRNQELQFPGTSWLAPVSANGMKFLLAQCDDQEYLKTYKIDFRVDDAYTTVYSNYTCCKLIFNAT